MNLKVLYKYFLLLQDFRSLFVRLIYANILYTIMLSCIYIKKSGPLERPVLFCIKRVFNNKDRLN